MPQDITIFITDRNGVNHEVFAPTDMNMNVMELIRSYELAEEGTVGVCGGMAMCASCQCYILNDVLKTERISFLNDFTKIRGAIEHEDFELDRFILNHKDHITTLIEPNFQGNILSNKISFYYDKILELIEKLTIYFAGINCEELNSFYKLYKTVSPDYPNLIYGYKYRIMEMPFVFETIRCGYN